MKVLAIDSATSTATVAVIEDQLLVGEYTINDKKAHSQKLVALIDHLLAACGLQIEDIDLFACSKGPGSFTGLRIGAATVKAMAQSMGKPIVGVPTLDALAYNLYDCKNLVCPILDAQQEMVYAAAYVWENRQLSKKADYQAVHIRHLLDNLSDLGLPVTFTGDAVPLHRQTILDVMPGASFAPGNLIIPRASSCGFAALELYKHGINEDYNRFKPIYIRKSQAEVEYEKKQNINIRPMVMEDVDAICEVENLSFKTPWSRESFVSELSNNVARYLVAEKDGIVVGYGGLWQIVDEGHVTNIAVHPDYRGKKIGEKIVDAMITAARKSGINRLTLEVRMGNTPARKLYEKFGFLDYGVRKGYYSDTGEDALIMWLEL